MTLRNSVAVVCLAVFEVLALAGCGAVSEEDQFQLLNEARSPEVQTEAARRFLEAFPESRRRLPVARRFFQAALETGHGAVAEEAAQAYLGAAEESRRNSLRNYLAWSLAERGLALDLAEEYARLAVKYSRDEESRSLASYLDTLAYVLFRKGEVATAEELQGEAVRLQEASAELLGRLALYQFENGKSVEALQTGARAILLGNEREALQYFSRWVGANGRELAEAVVIPAVEEYLEESGTPLRRGRAALLLALAGLQLDRAEELARAALAGTAGQESRQEKASLEVYLARALVAKGSTEGAVALLEPQQLERPPWDELFWFTLGRAYRLSDRIAEAREVLMVPLVMRHSELVLSELRAAGLEEDEARVRVAAARRELEEFDPGRFEGPVPSSTRMVLVELFTGAECNPCQAADLAMDQVAEYYPEEKLAILEHHVHVPGADPLTTPATEARYQRYGDGGTPTAWFNGTESIGGGGPPMLKKYAFQRYRSSIEKSWNERPKVDVRLSARRIDDQVTVSVKVEPFVPGLEEGKVRIALVERSVEYEGGNGIKRHSFVVRHLSDPDAEAARVEEGRATVDYEIDLTQVEADQRSYLEGFEAEPPERFEGFAGFREKPVTLDRSKLTVVAWVESRDSGAVLQAAAAAL